MLRAVRIAALLGLIWVALCLDRDLYLFPGARFSHPMLGLGEAALPRGAERVDVRTSDGVSLDVWRTAPAVETPTKRVALALHGDSGSLVHFYPIQQWLTEQGFITYALDYRGFGRSRGWPTEKGIYRDCDALYDAAVRRERVSPDQILVFGISFGTGPAAYLAARHPTRALALVAPYTSLPDVDRYDYPLGRLIDLYWYQIPTLDFVKALSVTRLIVAHGQMDDEIPASHSRAIARAYHGATQPELFIKEEATHYSILSESEDDLRDAIARAFE